MNSKKIKSWLLRIGATIFGLNVFTACYGMPYRLFEVELSGTVKDTEGNPVEDVKIERYGRICAATDIDGKFDVIRDDYWLEDLYNGDGTPKDTIHLHLNPSDTEVYEPSDEVMDIIWGDDMAKGHADYVIKKK